MGYRKGTEHCYLNWFLLKMVPGGVSKWAGFWLFTVFPDDNRKYYKVFQQNYYYILPFFGLSRANFYISVLYKFKKISNAYYFYKSMNSQPPRPATPPPQKKPRSLLYLLFSRDFQWNSKSRINWMLSR